MRRSRHVCADSVRTAVDPPPSARYLQPPCEFIRYFLPSSRVRVPRLDPLVSYSADGASADTQNYMGASPPDNTTKNVFLRVDLGGYRDLQRGQETDPEILTGRQEEGPTPTVGQESGQGQCYRCRSPRTFTRPSAHVRAQLNRPCWRGRTDTLPIHRLAEATFLRRRPEARTRLRQSHRIYVAFSSVTCSHVAELGCTARETRVLHGGTMESSLGSTSQFYWGRSIALGRIRSPCRLRSARNNSTGTYWDEARRHIP
jgi:hypothetical protein